MREMLNWIGLSERAAARPATLSGGEQQRVAIARAVIARPELLVADEPTGNVDPAMAERLLHLFHSLHRLGTTVVMATHDWHLIERVPGRIICIWSAGGWSIPIRIRLSPRPPQRHHPRYRRVPTPSPPPSYGAGCEARGKTRATGAEARALDDGGGAHVMSWVIAIMLFLTLLAGAAGLATARAAGALDRQMAGRLTVQIVEGEAQRRDAAAAQVLGCCVPSRTSRWRRRWRRPISRGCCNPGWAPMRRRRDCRSRR
ncbi:hypothetical protein GCM10020258_16660 [Sphingomonas yabuuchiae]